MWRRKIRLWEENEGRCYWCGVRTILVKGRARGKPWHATIDHLRSRYDQNRGEPNLTPEIARTVLACYRCNNRRASDEQRSIPIEERWRRSNSRPKYFYTRLLRMVLYRIKSYIAR